MRHPFCISEKKVISRLSNLNELYKTYDLEIFGPDELSEASFTPNAYCVRI